jgi:hypothetical protein
MVNDSLMRASASVGAQFMIGKHAMRRYVVATLLLVALMPPALAATKFYVVVIKLAFVVEDIPDKASGLNVIAAEDGYALRGDAVKALKTNPYGHCKNIFK